ncbi:hypothetical protein TTHERM_00188900 (macronuclear) [Tetrahymena thermophila SB210]|uniref:Uncharacterized protein n=1 Tax=Tetrahymena thermophila (strain SB210) TaxID=312017 RepID=I7M7Z5_TETTS|nr:hypothetical protein TTHERM_00188900 [Tetrahymena thermophila SB210]EAR96321.3 hypothetical protein TTHERM_00188900 [Tetrahymena thermophila SB210]|eukprot:XP_001016566.3 hypothetical protein TTHERM_00188900 [Tetrahymena thermophila SB210]
MHNIIQYLSKKQTQFIFSTCRVSKNYWANSFNSRVIKNFSTTTTEMNESIHNQNTQFHLSQQEKQNLELLQLKKEKIDLIDSNLIDNYELNLKNSLRIKSELLQDEKYKDQDLSKQNNLISKIHGCKQLQEILQLFEDEKEHFDLNCYINCLSMIEGELKKQALKSSDKHLLDDIRYKKIIEYTFSQTKNLDEYQRITLLSWIAKSTQHHTLRGLQESEIKGFCLENEKLISEGYFNFYNLVYVLYNFELLSFNSIQTSDIIYNIVENKKETLTKNQAQLLMYIYSSKTLRHIPLSLNELQLSYKCSIFLENQLDNISLHSKAKIFQHLSTIQHCFNRPYFKIPQLLYKLEAQILQNLNQLTEQEIISIAASFQYIPNSFSNSILTEIQNIIFTQTQKENQFDVSFNLVVNFVVILNKMRKVYFTDQEYQSVSQLLIRIFKEQLDKGQNINVESWIQLLMKIKELKSKEVNEVILQCLKMNSNKIQFSLLEYLIIENVDVSEFLSEQILSQYLNQADQIRLYVILYVANLKESKTFQTIENNIEECINANFKKSLDSFTNSHLKGFEIYSTISKIFIKKLQGQANVMLQYSDSAYQFFYMMSKLLYFQTDRILWVDWIDKNERLLKHGSTTIHLLQAFSNNQNKNISQLITIVHLSQYYYFSLQSLLIYLKDTQFVTIKLYSYGNIIKRLFKMMSNKLKDGSTSNLRLDLIFSLYLILQNLNFYQSCVGNLLKQAYLFKLNELNKKNNRIQQNLPNLVNELEVVSQNYPLILMKLDVFPEEYLVSYYNKYFNSISSMYHRALLLSQIIKYKKQENIPNIQQNLKDILNEAQNVILDQSVEFPNKVEQVQVFLLFPYSVFKDYINNGQEFSLSLNQLIYDNLENLNKEDFINIMNAINLDEHSTYPQFYKPLLNSLVAYFSKNLLVFKNFTMVSFLKKFVDAKYLNIDFINSVIQFSSVKFQKFTYEERVGLISYFSSLKIVQKEFFNQNFLKIQENPSAFRSYTFKLLQSIFQLGYVSKDIEKGILAIVQSDSQNSIQDVKEFYLYCSVLLINSEIDVESIKYINMTYSKQNQKKSSEKYQRNNVFPHIYHLIVERMLQKLLGNDYQQQIQNGLIQNQTKQLDKTLSLQKKQRDIHETLSIILKLLNIQHQINYYFQNANIYCDIYLIEKKIAINLYPNSCFAYDEQTPQGQYTLIKNYIKVMEPQINDVKILNASLFKFTDMNQQKDILNQTFNLELDLEQYQSIIKKIDVNFLNLEQNKN